MRFPGKRPVQIEGRRISMSYANWVVRRLVMLAVVLALAACQEKTALETTGITVDKVRGDLIDKKVPVAEGGEMQLTKAMYVALKDKRKDGKQAVSRVAVKAIDPKTGTGVEGELQLTYRSDERQWLFQKVEPLSLKRMDEKYAGRLIELVPFPLHFAANIGDLAGVEQELKKGTPVDQPEEKKQSTALMFAAERGFLDILKTLAAAGANVNHQNRYGFTALHAAVSNNHPEIAKFLLEHGAEVDAVDQQGQTALYFAAERGHLELARMLVAKGADVNRKAKKNWPPLYAATTSNSLEVAKFLIENGAQVNIKTETGLHSPLLIAAHNNNPQMVRLLLDAGADVSGKLSSHHSGFHNQTALDIARQRGNQEIIELLEKKPAK